MKKVFTLFLFILPILTFSQTNKFIFGLEGGLNLSSIRATEGYFLDKSPRIGVLTGVTVQYPLTKKTAFKSGLYYENKGSKGTAVMLIDANGMTIGSAKGFNNFNYLHIPFLIKTTLGSKAKFFANAGPNIGLLINQNTRVKQTADFNGFKENFTEMYKKIEFGISGGLGFATPLNNKTIFSFEVRDNLGLTSVNKEKDFPERTNSINFLFGVSRVL